MLRISKKVEYALIALLHMAGRSSNELTTAKDLAKQYNIPLELMGKVLQQLARNNFIRSVQGIKGGYHLVFPLERINVSHVVKILEGPIKIVNCIEHKGNCECRQLDFCTIKNPMEIIQKKLENFFDTITLEDLNEEIYDFKKNHRYLTAMEKRI